MNISRINRAWLIAGIIIFTVFTPLFILFVIPIFFGILNTGNIFGMSVCILFITAFLLYPKLKLKRAFIVFIRIMLPLFFLCVIYAAVLSANMLVAAKKTPPPDLKSASVIVLGAKTTGGEPAAMLENRLNKALPYLTGNENFVCVTTGGLDYKSGYTEAYVMQKYLTTHGIDASRIIMEDESSNTFENIIFAEKHIRESGLPEAVVIVSDGFHLWRALMTAEKCGFEVYTLACDTSAVVFPTYWVRELFALTRDLVFRR